MKGKLLANCVEKAGSTILRGMVSSLGFGHAGEALIHLSQPILQMLAVGIMTAVILSFIFGRLRYDLVALAGLLAAVIVGVVPPESAFSGFADDIVIIIASALITSKAISRSGVADRLVRRSLSVLTTPRRQVSVLAGIILVLSAFIKNIGALSMLMPAAYQFSQRSGTPVSRLLMPMSFASLLGGMVTLVGTSPNIIVSRLREDISGQPFRMFDFVTVGLPLAIAGFVFVSIFFFILPVRTKRDVSQGLNQQPYVIEAFVPETALVVGQPASCIRKLSSGDVKLTSIVRKTHTRINDPQEQLLMPSDHLLLTGVSTAVDALIQEAGLTLPQDKHMQAREIAAREDSESTEAVVTGDSLLTGWSPSQLRLSDRFGVDILGVQRRGASVRTRLKAFRFAVGDVIVLRGDRERLPQAMEDLGLLPLAARAASFGASGRWHIPVVTLAVAMCLMALQIVSVPVAFFGAAVIIVLTASLSIHEAYEALDAPVLVTLAALIPLSESLRSTGVTDIVSQWLSSSAAALPPLMALGFILVVAMLVTPFLNNAATVLVAAPIAAGFAKNLGYNPEPFLMAVAVGAASDFLTPIGHQCNMLVMGPGGYRFGDYWKLGLPLSIIVAAAGVPLIAWAWPL